VFAPRSISQHCFCSDAREEIGNGALKASMMREKFLPKIKVHKADKSA